MEGMVGIVVGFVGCFVIIITLTIVACCYGEENNRLRRENRQLRRVLDDYHRLEQASLSACITLAQETQRHIGGR